MARTDEIALEQMKAVDVLERLLRIAQLVIDDERCPSGCDGSARPRRAEGRTLRRVAEPDLPYGPVLAEQLVQVLAARFVRDVLRHSEHTADLERVGQTLTNKMRDCDIAAKVAGAQAPCAGLRRSDARPQSAQKSALEVRPAAMRSSAFGDERAR